MPHPLENKRTSMRVPVDLQARFTFENKEHLARVLNLSIDGMFLQTNYMLLQNDMIEVFFEVPGAREPMWMKARVVWGTWVEGMETPMSGMGIQFVRPLATQKEDLEAYLQKVLDS